MRHFIVKTLVIFLPFVCFMSWSSVAQGCAHADEDALAQTHVDAGKDVSLFPVDPGTDVPDQVDSSVVSADPEDAEVASVSDVSVGEDTNSTVREDANCRIPVSFSYLGPAMPGTIWIEAWWQPPSEPPRPWGVVTECPDPIAGDGSLECLFSLPCGTASFEFQVYLPGAKYWGDESVTGGNGSPIGTVSVFTTSGNLPYVLIPNPKGVPYMNGFIASVY